MAQLETLLYEEDDGVARVTLNRPEVHNAFNMQMQRELRDLWRGLRRNDDVRVVILTGAGERAFCTGIDRTETMSDYGSEESKKREKMIGSGSTPFMFDDPGANLGPKFPQGLLVVQDGRNLAPRERQNYKFVSWKDVAESLGLE